MPKRCAVSMSNGSAHYRGIASHPGIPIVPAKDNVTHRGQSKFSAPYKTLIEDNPNCLRFKRVCNIEENPNVYAVKDNVTYRG